MAATPASIAGDRSGVVFSASPAIAGALRSTSACAPADDGSRRSSPSADDDPGLAGLAAGGVPAFALVAGAGAGGAWPASTAFALAAGAAGAGLAVTGAAGGFGCGAGSALAAPGAGVGEGAAA